MESASIADVVQNLDSSDESRRKMAAFRLQNTISDPGLADRFVAEGGLPKLRALVTDASGNTLSYALASMANLLELDQGWAQLTPAVIDHLVQLVIGQPLVNILRGAMAILAHIVSHPVLHPASDLGMRALEPAIAKAPQFLETLVGRVTSADHALCVTALQLINALVRDAIANNSDGEWPRFINRLQDLGIVRAVYSLMQSEGLQQDLAGPVLEFQGLVKIILRRWRDVRVVRTKAEHRRAMREVHRAGKLGEGERTPRSHARSGSTQELDARAWRTLGFDEADPLDELQATGYLGLVDLLEYIRRNEDGFHNLLLEQAALPPPSRCPLAKASMAATSILYDHFEIDNEDTDAPLPPSPDVRTRLAFDKAARPFLLEWGRLHSAAVAAFTRLWAAAGAALTDFSKIEELVRILIEHTLALAPRTAPLPTLLDALARHELPALRTLQMELVELTHDSRWGNHLRQIKDDLHAEALQFVREQRIRCLLAGAWFAAPPASAAASRPWRFARLSHNRRLLHYADFPTRLPSPPDLPSLPHTLDLTTVASVVSSAPPSPSTSTPSITPPGPTSTTIALFTSPPSPAEEAEQPEPALILHLPPASTPHLSAELLDGLLLLLNQAPITDATARLVSFVARYGVRIRLLNVAVTGQAPAGAGFGGGEKVGGGMADGGVVVVPGREGVEEEFFYDMSVF